MDDHKLALTDAVERAVQSGERELDDLDRVVSSLLDVFERVTGSVVGADTGSAGGPSGEAEQFGRRLRDHLASQRDALSTFNIAFFGRTGAGKSTLLSTFGGLDGEYVSPGESDWTTDVVPIDWHGCRMWDTPGINGWGRTESRVELEERAREAVERADTVLLCFDTQSQQASEFTKVAEWVREYGKPAIAVLNVRNLRWRHPAKVASESARQSLSRGVREHADNIRTELAKIGLPRTPIVAIQSRRALFARAATPFQGPAAKNFESDREQFGVDYLARWSNFPVLEAMIAASICEGGSELRRTALREGMRGMLDEKAIDLDRRSRDLDLRIAEQEARIEELLDVLGYIEGADREKYLGSPDDDVLSALESERGIRFTTSHEGRLSRHTADLLQPHLSGPREAALKRSDDLIYSAFSDGKPIDEERFTAVVYVMDDTDAAVSAIAKAVAGFLKREIRLSVSEDLALAGISTESTMLDGATGRIKRRLARAMQAGGLAAGAAAGAAVVPGVANIWNPAGWVVTTTAIGLGAISQVGRYVGSRTANSAEKQTAQAKAEAIRTSRAAVHETFDRIEQELIERSRALSWRAAAPVLTELMRNSLEMRAERRALGSVTAQLRETASVLPVSDGAGEILDRAQSRVVSEFSAVRAGRQEGCGTGDSVLSRRVLLGEDWLGERDDTSEGGVVEQLQNPILEEASAADRTDLEHALARAWDVESFDAVVGLIQKVEEFVATSIQADRVARSASTKPAVVILGDYSSGKSSLVKRLLVELGGQIPDDLDIRGGVATKSVQFHDLGHIRLVDTPGFQSGNPDHEHLALDTASSAALVLIVLHVNLLIGEMSQLEAIVKGSGTTAAKGSRTIYLINRSDELGVDPLAAPEDFVLLKNRKEAELVAALGSRGIYVDPVQVHTLAGDPFGEVGARTGVRRADYDHHRSWDGVSPLVRALDSFSAQCGRAGSAGARLDESMRSLLQSRVRVEGLLRELRTGVESLTKILQSMDNSEQDGMLLETAIRGRVRRTVEPRMNKAQEQVRAAGPEEIDTIVSVSNSWWCDTTLETDVERIVHDAREEIEKWFLVHSSAIGRELESVSTSATAFNAESSFADLQISEMKGPKLVVGVAGDGVKVAKLAANRDVVYQIGKAVGWKFKPWGAVKAAGRMGKVAKVAPILAVAGVALDGYAMAKGEIAGQDREKQRLAAVDFISSTADEFMNHVLNGEANDGLIPALQERMAALTEHKGELERDHAEMTTEIDAQEYLMSGIERLLAEAEAVRHRSGDCT